MKSLVYNGPRKLNVEEKSYPQKGPDDVIIKVKAVGICGSDVHGYLGVSGRRIPPMVMGHEFSGIVAETGTGVPNFKTGDRVVVNPLFACGHCGICKAGFENVCPNKKFLGAMDMDGAMSEYVAVPGNRLLHLPENVSFVQGAVVEPLAVAYRAAGRVNVTGKTVLVVGAGPIGLFIIKMLKLQNPSKIIVSDLSDYRLGIAKKQGADCVINPKDEDIKTRLRECTGCAQVDVSFEAVGAVPTVNQALNSLKNKGKCVFVGNAAKDITIDMQNIVVREIDIFGTYSCTEKEFSQTIQLLESGKVNPDFAVSRCITLEDAPLYFEKLAGEQGELIKVVIVFND